MAALSDRPVRAAGGVVWRNGDGATEVVVVHRPAYDDWSLPKGKAAPGESDEECALREVSEETGLRVELGPELPGTRYRDRHGRDKVVRYWAMRPAGGQLESDEEVDEARWVPIDEACRLMSYERDRPVLDALEPALAAAGEG